MISDDCQINLPGCRDEFGNILISDWKLREMLPPHLRPMSDRYKIMCGCEYCIQMYNVHQNYNQYINCLIKKMENKIPKTRPNTRDRRDAKDRLHNYKSKVQVNGNHRYPRVKDAMYCMMCKAPDEQFPSLRHIDCVLSECTDCPKYDQPKEEQEIDNNDEHISFHWYDTLPSCSIH